MKKLEKWKNLLIQILRVAHHFHHQLTSRCHPLFATLRMAQEILSLCNSMLHLFLPLQPYRCSSSIRWLLVELNEKIRREFSESCSDRGEIKLTNNLQISFSWPHRICVYLTHIPTSITLLDFSYMQIPTTMVVVRKDDPRILCDDIMMNAENRLSVDANPCDLLWEIAKSL